MLHPCRGLLWHVWSKIKSNLFLCKCLKFNSHLNRRNHTWNDTYTHKYTYMMISFWCLPENRPSSASRPFGWAVWHSCRMGDWNQEQTRGRIGPQLRLGNLRVDELLFRSVLHALYSTRPHGLVQAIFWHTCPDLRFRSVIRLDSLDPHCT